MSSEYIYIFFQNCKALFETSYIYTGVPGGKVNILGGHSIGHSKKESLYEHVSYSERVQIFGAQYFGFGAQYFPSLPRNAPLSEACESV
jgi:hypothetical protein